MDTVEQLDATLERVTFRVEPEILLKGVATLEPAAVLSVDRKFQEPSLVVISARATFTFKTKSNTAT